MNIFRLKGINFLLILISIIFSYIFFNDQVALRPALVLSGIIDYEGSFSPLKYYFLNSWTLLTQFAALLLKIGLDSGGMFERILLSRNNQGFKTNLRISTNFKVYADYPNLNYL